MEFYVVDPKNKDFSEWAAKIKAFLEEEGLSYTVSEGDLYYIGDDIVTPWHEDSLLFKISAPLEGFIEVRDEDRNFYLLSEPLDLFQDGEVVQSLGYRPHPEKVVYGFQTNSQKSCRFHRGPITDVNFFCGEEDDFPPILRLNQVLSLFNELINFINNNTARIQDVKKINLEKINIDLEVDLTFKHPASLDALNELLVEEEGYDRSKTSLQAVFQQRDPTWIQRFLNELPTFADDYQEAMIKAVWRGKINGKPKDLFYCGVERRQLNPFVQLPLHCTDKTLVEKLRKFIKGHRIDRQEYYLEP